MHNFMMLAFSGPFVQLFSNLNRYNSGSKGLEVVRRSQKRPKGAKNGQNGPEVTRSSQKGPEGTRMDPKEPEVTGRGQKGLKGAERG